MWDEVFPAAIFNDYMYKANGGGKVIIRLNALLMREMNSSVHDGSTVV